MYSRFKIIAAGLVLLSSGWSANAWAQCFKNNPLPGSMVVTSPFGPRFHPRLHIWRCHCGVDLRARTPIAMLAVSDAKVTNTGFDAGGGNSVTIDLGDGRQVTYFHASIISKKRGDSVAAGDVVGATGNTGEWSTGPHLHLKVAQKGTPVDPIPFMCEGVTNASTGVVAPPPGAPPSPSETGAGLPAEVEFPHMDDMAMRDFLYKETHKRFMNPQWYLELENPAAAKIITDKLDPKSKGEPDKSTPVNPKISMLRELNIMMSISNLLKEQIANQKIATEAELAALMSIDARNYAEKVNAISRQNVGKAR